MIHAATLEDSEAVATVLIESRRAFLPFAPSAQPEHEVRHWVRSILLPSQCVVVWEESNAIVAVMATSTEGVESWIDQL